jgi:hypothetical protein
VRTFNVNETEERYGKIIVPRLAGIAKRFRLSDPEQVGLIGITEPTRRIKQCLYVPGGNLVFDGPEDPDDLPEELPSLLPDLDDNCTATRGLEAVLRHEFDEEVTHYHNDNGGSGAKDIGIVMGRQFQRVSNHSRRMGLAWAGGPNIDLNWTWARKLQMVRMLHRPSGLHIRFFCTHFSPGSSANDRGKRKKQAERLVKFLREDDDFVKTSDPLPPILVGDFNARRLAGQEPEASVQILQKYFRQPLGDLLPLPGGPPRQLIDQVLIGRREYFSHIRYELRTMAHRRVRLTDVKEDSRGRRYAVLTEDGYPRAPLSDHGYSEGFRFRIEKL